MKTLYYFFIFFAAVLLLAGCNDEKDNPLTPSQKLLGIYKTDKSVKVNIKTDFCSGALEDVAYEQWMLRWEIKESYQAGVLDITMTYQRSGYVITNSSCQGSTGYVVEPSPMFVKGYMDGDILTVKYQGEEIMKVNTSNPALLSGGLKYSYCMVYCQEVYTDETSFELTKEK
jgi:hypothetical protein